MTYKTEIKKYLIILVVEYPNGYEHSGSTLVEQPFDSYKECSDILNKLKDKSRDKQFKYEYGKILGGYINYIYPDIYEKIVTTEVRPTTLRNLILDDLIDNKSSNELIQ